MFAALSLLAATIASIIVIQALAGDWWIHKELEREARTVADDFALSFGAFAPDSPSAREISALVAMTLNDPHVCAVIVRGSDGSILHRTMRAPDPGEPLAEVFETCAEDVLCAACKAFPVRLRDGGLAFGASTALWTSDGAYYGVVTVVIHDPAYSAVGAQLVRAGVAAGLLVGLFAVPIVAMGARGMAAPLRKVAGAAEALASGRRPEPIPPAGPREVASLATSFNRMALALDATTRELHDANARLESTVRERTRELRRVNARLELELDERGHFFRAISHDLGAPLRNIAGAITLIRRRHADLLPQDALANLDLVERAIALELDMLRELLDITRLGATEERPEPVETLAIARDIARMFHHDLASRAIDLRIVEPMPVVRVEPARFRQVLQNLIDNAVKYMGDRPVKRIEVEARLGDSGAEFSVADTGPGIPPREHDTIFDVFRRGSNAPSGVKGAGVGLAAVKTIVQRWGGDIRIESEPGRGARFIFLVPPDRLVTLPGTPPNPGATTGAGSPDAASENQRNAGSADRRARR